MVVTVERVAPDLHAVAVDGRRVGWVQRRSGRFLPLHPNGRKAGRSHATRRQAVAELTRGR